jgi:hypothetical protein
MQKRVIFEVDGDLRVGIPAINVNDMVWDSRTKSMRMMTEDEAVARYIAGVVPPGADPQVVTIDDLPIGILQRRYRAAWTLADGTVSIDMEKARDVHLAALRRARDAELKRLDVEESKAADDAQALAVVRSRKATLRDMPLLVADSLNAAETIQELEAIGLP